MSAVMAFVNDTVPFRLQMTEFHILNSLSIHLN